MITKNDDTEKRCPKHGEATCGCLFYADVLNSALFGVYIAITAFTAVLVFAAMPFICVGLIIYALFASLPRN